MAFQVAEHTYIFIDGEYLRRIHDEAMRDFFGVDGDLRKKEPRQKEVDILLAVDMLTHGFNGSMQKAVLVAGDLDFRRIVEALVRNGVFVEIWYRRTSIAPDLPGAADFGQEIRFRRLYEWSTEA